ncbi:uncharacterized protein LOC108158553 isoform X3 [Drosophila miranda]|uniref:uncharacterized protein LOC108158553 isoform X3 n=1 Tax=Drosophila miranda TaxID=7229 RepID=UPI0007E86C29|nr:uncharacterized protein LOC108158553 isoform X3 [Drosophila miranda]
MEPPGGVPPDKDRQLVLRNSAQSAPGSVPIVVAAPNAGHGTTSAAANPQQQSSSQSTHLPQSIKPTTLSLQPHGGVHAMATATATQLSPSAAANNNAAATAATATSSGSGNANSGNSPALASTATAISATTQAATAFSGSSVGHHHLQHHQHPHAHSQPATHQQQLLHSLPHQQSQAAAPATAPAAAPATATATATATHHHHHSSISGPGGSGSGGLLAGAGSGSGSGNPQQTIEKLSRPMAFDKMEVLVREMQDQEHGVPVRQQKMFLTSIPYAFMGYDLIEWLMDRLQIEESEALNIANQLCLHGYFFPVNDSKTLTVKDDSSLYRFQTPYYWPWQHKAPDNVEYAIYLAKRSLRNKQRHALEDYEAEALSSLHKNLKGKWDFISMQAEEQVRLAKERKKGDKIVGDSQERAYWRVHRPPPGQFTPLEPCPVPSRDRQGFKPNKKKTVDDVQREVDYLGKSLNRTRMKMSQACESLVCYSETFSEYDFFLQPALPSNPWVTEDITFWQLNNTFVDIPTEKRVKRWAISIEELVSDPTGLQEFTTFLEKEYSHENIRFWIAVNRLRRSAHSQVARKVNEIYEEFLKPGAPCEINIDGKTMESVLRGLKNPSRFTFDSASEHIYMLLLKKDCYPRFIRSEHYKRLLDTGIQPSYKKRFFNFGGVSGAKKKMTAALSSQPNLGDAGGSKGSSSAAGGTGSMMQAPPPGSLARRRGSDRSLTGSAHELAVIGVNKEAGSKVPHSHSQSNLSEIPFSSDSIYRGDMPQPHRHTAIMDVGIYAAYGGNRESSLQALPENPKTKSTCLDTLESTTALAGNCSAVCPWDEPVAILPAAQVKLSVCPWEQDTVTDPAPAPATATAPATAKATAPATAKAPASAPVAVLSKQTAVIVQPLRLTSTSSDSSDVADRLQRNLGIRHQNTVDSGETSIKRLTPNFTEQRRASVSFTPSSDYQFGRTAGACPSTTSTTPTVGTQSAGVASSNLTPLQARSAVFGGASGGSSFVAVAVAAKDQQPLTGSDVETEVEEELNKLSQESSASELPVLVTPTPTQTPPLIAKVTPPPEEYLPIQADSMANCLQQQQLVESCVTHGKDVTVVKEVQIELIESRAYEKDLATTTPTIKVLELVATTPGSNIRLPSGQSQEALTTTTEDAALADDDETEQAAPDQAQVPLSEVSEALQDELSPTTDEYQEGLQFGGNDTKDVVDDFDSIDSDIQLGYIPPAPTPAPSMAPLAELDVDTMVDDDPADEPASSTERPAVAVAVAAAVAPTATATATPTSSNDEARKRRKKRNSDGKKHSSQEDKDKDGGKDGSGSGGGGVVDPEHNAVCPWEDENVSTSDGTFVKTYATLGYL